ncbi:MAG: glycosyltransferase family 39 protein [Selenomonadaceae bacterium]|nr:glycosyltransferase family 39 protein [Selenomonadaceae bacterium]
MILIKEIFSGKVKTHAAIFFASFLFLLIFSTSTSPLYDSWGDDSAIFQAVGRGWAEGLLPYVDLFENKGPLIFLIDAIGYSIAPRVGIFLLQIPAMYLSFLLAWRSLGLFLSGKVKIAAAVFMFVHYAVYTLDGNRTEEWSMLFLMAATYFFLRGLKEEKFSCPPLYGFIYGVGFGACVLLRMLNAAPLCLCAFLSAVFLIQAGEFKTLLKNLLNFCAGAVIVVLPFVIYFAAHGALYDALYGTILLNLNYSAQRGNFLMENLDEYTIHIVVHFSPLFIMIAGGAIEFIKNKSRVALSTSFIGAVMLILFMKLSPYQGYYALITPLLPILFVVLADLQKIFRGLWSGQSFSLKRTVCKLLLITVAFYPLILLRTIELKVVDNNSAKWREYHSEQNNAMLRIAQIIPPEERGSVMIWGEGTHVSHWILTTGIMPRCRFFSNIKAFANVDPNVKREWFENISSNLPRWIIYSVTESEFSGDYPDDWTKNFRKNRDADVEELLKEKYSIEAETKTYQNFFWLYRLND